MSKIRKWIKNGRSTAIMQSLMPAVLAAVMAIGEGFNPAFAILAVIGVISAHLAMNIADDWFDYRVDMLGDRDKVIRKGFRAMTLKYPYLTDGSETLRTTAYAIAQFTVFALACGAAIFKTRLSQNGFTGPDGAWWMVAAVALCGFLGAFYSVPPLKLAYRGLGELVIGVIFGPLLMTGVYYSSCGRVDPAIFAVSVPVGMLVLNILFTHSFIDMPGDAESNKMTFARLLGSTKICLTASGIFILVPFLMVVGAVVSGMLHPAYLAVLAALPRGIWLLGSLARFSRGDASVPEKPAKYLGPMQQWDDIRKMGIDWFMMRWFCARNLLSLFCMMIIVVKICLLIFSI